MVFYYNRALFANDHLDDKKQQVKPPSFSVQTFGPQDSRVQFVTVAGLPFDSVFGLAITA